MNLVNVKPTLGVPSLMTSVPSGVSLPALPKVPNFAQLIDQLLKVLPTAQTMATPPSRDLQAPSTQPSQERSAQEIFPMAEVRTRQKAEDPSEDVPVENPKDVRDGSRYPLDTEKDPSSRVGDLKARSQETGLPDEEPEPVESVPVEVEVDVMRLLSQEAMPIVPETPVQVSPVMTASTVSMTNSYPPESVGTTVPSIVPQAEPMAKAVPAQEGFAQPVVPTAGLPTPSEVQNSGATVPVMSGATSTELPSSIPVQELESAPDPVVSTPVMTDTPEVHRDPINPSLPSDPSVAESEDGSPSPAAEFGFPVSADPEADTANLDADADLPADSGRKNAMPAMTPPPADVLPAAAASAEVNVDEPTGSSHPSHKEVGDLLRMIPNQEPAPSMTVSVETPAMYVNAPVAVPVQPAMPSGPLAAAPSETAVSSTAVDAEGMDVPSSSAGAKTVAKAERTESRPQTASTEYIDRIVKAARLTESRGQTKIRIVLNPPHLGHLKVDLAVKENVLRMTLQTDTTAAKELIQSHVHQLKDALEQQGIRLGEFHILAEHSGDQPQSQEGHQSRESRESHDPRSSFMTEESEAFEESKPGRRAPSGRLQLIDVLA